jgi:RHS repeat-associated protein
VSGFDDCHGKIPGCRNASEFGSNPVNHNPALFSFLAGLNGGISDAYTYDAYGTRIASSGTTANSYLYCGQQFDTDLGLYYNRARYLNTDTGRFWTRDSNDGNNEDPLSLHKYLYVKDNPVNNIDPSGHDELDDLNLTGNMSASFDGLGNISNFKGLFFGEGTSGPDVTMAVLNTTLDVEQTFLKAPKPVQAQAALNIYSSSIGDGWDIEQLKELGFKIRVDFGGGSVLGTGSGAWTVQFGNPPKVYYAGSVNYILWGQMFALVSALDRNPITGAADPAYSESAAETQAWLYKTIFWGDFGMTKKEALAFVKFGYDGTDPSSTALSLTPNPNNLAAPARFDWKWIGLHDTAN